MNPKESRVKATAVTFLTVSLFLVRGAHATPPAGACTIVGTPGRDVLKGGPGNDQVNGGNGNDVLFGGAGNDTLQGDHGRDRVYGGGGSDIIFAWDGSADVIDGGLGTDRAWTDKLDRVYSIERSG